MTYVVTDNCINCKHTDCVDVCPVDCFYEGENFLVIKSDECIDCFTADTVVITENGNRPLSSFTEGEIVSLWNKDGWQEGRFSSFGQKPTQTVTLKPITRTDGKPSPRSTFTKTIRVTPTHRWFLEGQHAPDGWTTFLEPGSRIRGCVPTKDTLTKDYQRGVTHGLVFGDGSWNKQEKRSGLHLHYVQLYGDKAAKHKDLFSQLNWSPSCADHPGYAGTGVVRTNRNIKLELPEDESCEYMAGFVEGWIAADASIYSDSKVLRSTNHAALEWVKDYLEIAGYSLVGEGEESNTHTNYGERTAKIRWLTLRPGPLAWRVMSIEEDEPAETYCFTMLGKEPCFTLAGGIYTHNCGVCEPECPVDAILPDTASLPEDSPLDMAGWVALNDKYAEAGWPVLTEKKDPMPNHKEAEGQKDKIKLLSDKPGTGNL